MRFRLKTPAGTTTTLTTPDSLETVKDLLQSIGESLSLSPEIIKVRYGYPPKSISFEHGDKTLAEVAIKNGESFLVEGGPVPSESETSSSVSKPESKSGFVPPLPQKIPCIEMEEGTLLVREVDDDNSCLFRAVAYVLLKEESRRTELREMIARVVLSDPVTYNQVFLGRPPLEYAEWIMLPDSWGGAIELSIFSKEFNIEIDSIDIATGRIDRFGEGNYEARCFVVYSGIHYDAIAFLPRDNQGRISDVTQFEGFHAELIAEKCKELAIQLKEQRKYVDLANFTLRCGICKKGLKGQKEAQAHALESSHYEFTEYN